MPTAFIGFAAFSGTGKTQLICQLIPLLKQRGMRVAAIKASHHDISLDKPGKDSFRLHQSGAQQTLIVSPFRSGLISEHDEATEPDFKRSTEALNLESLDIVVVEGFRHEQELNKIELHRSSLGNPFLYPNDSNIVAIASDTEVDAPIHHLDLNQPEKIAEFILGNLQHFTKSTR